MRGNQAFAINPSARRSAPGLTGHEDVVQLKRWHLVGFAGLACTVLIWAIGATVFIFLKDDLSAGLMRGQVQAQYTYEERIAALRAHIDRLASRQVLDQDSLEARVGDLMSRQAQLETRQALVNNLASQAGIGAIVASSAATGSTTARKMPTTSPPGFERIGSQAPASSFAPLPTKPMPMAEPVRLRGVSEMETRDRERTSAADPGLSARLAAASRSMSLLEADQNSLLESVERTSRSKLTKLKLAIAEAGLNTEKFTAPLPSLPVGGPFVPLGNDFPENAFESSLQKVQAVVAAAEKLGQVAKSLPVRQPLLGTLEVTSGFGVRSDPFTRGAALHTGIDFRAEPGSAVRATAAGRVVTAEYTGGGYGNMVEIEHGNGLETRYAHMSSIAVTEGAWVEAGAIVGRVGSTGRSTGPHLHYETRVSGDPTDPQRFLRIGSRHQDLFF